MTVSPYPVMIFDPTERMSIWDMSLSVTSLTGSKRPLGGQMRIRVGANQVEVCTLADWPSATTCLIEIEVLGPRPRSTVERWVFRTG